MMSDFVDENVIVGILSRLPFESVVQCRCVCKRWRDLVHEPHFIQIYTASRTHQQPQQEQIVSFFMLVNSPKTNNYEFHLQDHYVNYSDDEDDDDDGNGVCRRPHSPHHSYYKVSTPIRSPQLLIGDIYTANNNVKWSIMGSINGLICLYGYNMNSYVVAPIIIIIYNPITREYLNVPTDDHESFSIKDGRHMANGFGYNPKTNEYKIVRIIHQSTSDKNVYVRWIQVYTLGSGGKWRITKAEGLFRTYFGSTGVCFEGAIYWLAGTVTLLYFDMEDEILRLVLVQPRNEFHYELIVFRERLCVIEASTHIWVIDINKNNPRNINTNMGKFFTIYTQNKVHTLKWPRWSGYGSQCTPIAVTRKNRVLSLYNKRSLVSFDPQTKTWESLGDIPMFEDSFHIVPYTKSLVSLKALGEEDAKIIESVRIVSYTKSLVSLKAQGEKDAKIIERQPATEKKRRSINVKTQMIKLFISLLLNM